MTNEPPIVNAVMPRVRFIFIVRGFFLLTLSEMLVILCIALVASAFVSLRHIIENLEGTYAAGQLFPYLFSALVNSQLAVKVLACVGLIASGTLAWRTGKKTRLVLRAFSHA